MKDQFDEDQRLFFELLAFFLLLFVSFAHCSQQLFVLPALHSFLQTDPMV
jgi:hypothetical protein